MKKCSDASKQINATLLRRVKAELFEYKKYINMRRFSVNYERMKSLELRPIVFETQVRRPIFVSESECIK